MKKVRSSVSVLTPDRRLVSLVFGWRVATEIRALGRVVDPAAVGADPLAFGPSSILF